MEWEIILERLLAVLHDLKARQVKADVVILFRPQQHPPWSIRVREHERTIRYGVIE